MSTGDSLTTAQILHAFSEEIAERGGSVNDTFDDGERLFVRSILPGAQEVGADDRLQGGVALRSFAQEIWVHPYVFRLVCRNGAIMAQTVASRRLAFDAWQDQENVLFELREAVGACCDREIFATSVEQMRSARNSEADLALMLLPMLSQLSRDNSLELAQNMIRRFFDDGDRTRFGLVNAVTSVARDTADPEMRWNLEELGGGIAIEAPRPIPQMPTRSQSEREEEALVL